jgi:malate dehydrogenase (oxaloacetate-decarboxylating)(NADP+)
VSSRTDLAEHKRPYAHDSPGVATLLDAVNMLKPTGLIGVSGQPATFTREILEAMARIERHPIIFALSNPTANSECTAEEAYRYTKGRALFASGSPFDPVMLDGKRLVPSQANNAYVFPGIALGIVAFRITRVTDEMFAQAARTLASLVSETDRAQGLLFPPLPAIRDVSQRIAVDVAKVAFDARLSSMQPPRDLDKFVREQMFEPEYRSYV